MNVLFEIKSRDQSSVQINWLVSPVFQWYNLLIVVGSPYGSQNGLKDACGGGNLLTNVFRSSEVRKLQNLKIRHCKIISIT
jgi:hypothetical protein